MATDRETILTTLLPVLETLSIDGVKVERNRDADLDSVSVPAVILFDGGENEPSDQRPWRPGMPWRITMTPEVLIVVEAKTADVGSVLNTLSAKVQKTIFSAGFEALAPILGSDGNLQRGPVETRLIGGNPARMAMALQLRITHTNNPLS